jgi:hypothetical protein
MDVYVGDMRKGTNSFSAMANGSGNLYIKKDDEDDDW